MFNIILLILLIFIQYTLVYTLSRWSSPFQVLHLSSNVLPRQAVESHEEFPVQSVRS